MPVFRPQCSGVGAVLRAAARPPPRARKSVLPDSSALAALRGRLPRREDAKMRSSYRVRSDAASALIDDLPPTLRSFFCQVRWPCHILLSPKRRSRYWEGVPVTVLTARWVKFHRVSFLKHAAALHYVGVTRVNSAIQFVLYRYEM